MDTIDNLISSSIDVIRRCSLKNGAILASYSKDRDTNNYRFVWPRDASYTLIAANILGIDIHENFFDWCQKAEGWEKTGLFYEKYHPSGKKARFNFQPDQTGTLLVALWDYYRDKKKINHEKLITKSAQAICRVWDKDHFWLVTEDLWEERKCFPDYRENFTYSLAACVKGLKCAYELINNNRWKETAEEMEKLIAGNRHFYRSFGGVEDRRIDASLLGLVWPFRIVDADDRRMVNAVELMESKIVKDHRVYRYEHDEYDGWMYKGRLQRNRGAGYWPLLNFWMAMYYAERGDKNKALKYYNKVIEDVKNHIPEQVFENKIQKSVTPLCWSHAMFLIASNKLGYIK